MTDADCKAGEVLNVATAEVPGDDPTIVPGEDPEPTEDKKGHITVEKVTTSKPADGKAYKLGEEITYKITVTNDGNLTISDITLTDTVKGYKAEDITAKLDKTTLAPGESATATFEHEVTEQDILAGTVKNEATATGNNPSDDPTGDEPGDTEDPTEDPKPHLTVSKETTSKLADGKGYALGEKITTRTLSSTWFPAR